MSHVDEGTLHAYLDGELSPAETQGVDAHLAQCPACRERRDVERALITRAGELLALAAPPDRELPPFRAGDLKPAPRPWWQVRLPLAWAATIALALGLGTYLGQRGFPLPAAAPSPANEIADRLAPTAPTSRTDTPVAAERASRKARVERRARPSQPAAPPTTGILAEEKREQSAPLPADSITRLRGAAALNARDEAEVASKAAAPAAAPAQAARLGERGYFMKDSSITPDRARLVLGRDPLVLPDLPIRGIYRARRIGYSGVVIVEQALDSTTVIDVVNGKVAPTALSEVVVTGAGRADAARADTIDGAALRNHRQRAADSLVSRATSAVFVEVHGPLSPDSLAALRRLLRPLPR